MAHVLGQNQYGKAENRIVRVHREADRHHLKDLNVSVSLRGDFEDVHLTGSNANCLPTDSTKNTVYAFAKRHGIESAEGFAMLLARHFVENTERGVVHSARIRIEEYSWDRIAAASDRPGETADTGHSFVRNGQEVRTTEVEYDGGRFRVVSGLKDLVVMNTTDSEFWGYLKDPYTTLPEAYDRILATQVTARWAFGFAGRDAEDAAPDWNHSYREVRRHLLEAFAQTYSYSLQQTLHAMGTRVLDHRAEVDEVRLELPNKHHFLVDLEPFGLKNENEVYYAADRMYGLIEGTVHREGVTPVIPVS
ncbi:factor-independent urate hydroxylase [Kitasatospora cheerisanensis]|uniref:Uricase n=1 Tax=Kitasatospora cheerisanensis KCTC 2395 TaxID=1348663 RepID=A0A066YKW9_9ACTN|nr:urate oxidase [Kitasatospora cheerisanensis]KDN81792.1 urate oxidase [Kitasatospora cheerisanensis KCTC 2395]